MYSYTEAGFRMLDYAVELPAIGHYWGQLYFKIYRRKRATGYPTV